MYRVFKQVVDARVGMAGLLAALSTPVVAQPLVLSGNESVEIGPGDSPMGLIVYDHAQATLAGGLIAGEAKLYDNGVLWINSGQVAQSVQAFGFSYVNMTGGEVGTATSAFDVAFALHYSTFVISGGTIYGDAQSYHRSHFTMNGGHIATDAEAHGTSTFQMTGGSVGNSIRARASGTFNMLGGTADSWASAEGKGRLNIRGGQIGGPIYGADQSVITLSGGTLSNYVILQDTASLVIEATGFDFDHDGDANTPNLSFTGSIGDELVLTAADAAFVYMGDPGNGISRVTLRDLNAYFVDGSIFNARIDGAQDFETFFGWGDVEDGDPWAGSLTLRIIPAPSAAALIPVLALCSARRSRR